MPRMEVQRFFKVVCICSKLCSCGATFFNGLSHWYRFGW